MCLQRGESRSMAFSDGGVEQSESAAGAVVRTWELILHMVRSHWRVLNRGLTAGFDLYFKSYSGC